MTAANLDKKFNRSISLLTWGYNEEELLEEFLDKAFKMMDENVEDYEIVFINDGSTDRTAEIVENYAKKRKELRVIHNEKNMNVGYSVRRAIKSATKEFLFWQTIDWSYDLKNLRICLELLNYYDVVVGIRPYPIRLFSYIPFLRSMYRIKSRSDNLQKAIVSLGNYYVLRILFGIPFQDFQNIFFFKAELLRSFELKGDSSFISPQMLLKAYEKGAKFIEVPIKFIPRKAGEAKGTKPTSILKSIKEISSHWLDWGWRFRVTRDMNFKKRIHRILTPFNIDEEVLKMLIPLFKEFN